MTAGNAQGAAQRIAKALREEGRRIRAGWHWLKGRFMRGPAPEPAPKWPKLLAEFIFALMLLVALDKYPPFGLENVVKRQVALVMQRVLAPWHGALATRRPLSAENSPGQHAVTVVRLDAPWFHFLHMAPQGRPVWPPPIRTIEVVLQRVIAAEPRVVFIDLAFPVAPREAMPGQAATRVESVAALAAALNRLQPKMPVFIGEVVYPEKAEDIEDCGGFPLLPEDKLDAARITDTGLRNALAGNSGRLGFVEISQPGLVDGEYQLSPLRLGKARSCSAAVTDRPYLASPALALFKVYTAGCTASGDKACTPEVRDLAEAIDMQLTPGDLARFGPSQNPKGKQLAGKLNGSLSMLWSTRLTPVMAALRNKSADADNCQGQVGNRLVESFRALLSNAVDAGEADVANTRCLAIDNLSARDVILDVSLPNDRIRTAQDLLRDRAVIIGATVPQARDMITSPVNGDVGGAYAHAVALENLLSFGSRLHSSNGGGYWAAMLLGLLGAIGMRALMHPVVARSWLLRPLPMHAPLQVLLTISQYVIIPLAIFFVVCMMAGFGVFVLTDLPLTKMAGPLLMLLLPVIETTHEAVRVAIENVLHRND